jgi:ABC-type multidrug transport system fused ATPase/permease subunit
VLGIRPSVVEPPRAHREPPVLGHVRFEDVHFRYAEDCDESRVRLEDEETKPTGRPAPWVLRGITLEAKPGEQVAIVGPSGAGKSTLVALLPRLYDTTRGRIVIDGVDVRRYALKTLRSSIAIVAQDAFVFTGSVYDNIAYARPNASRDEVLEAARAAYADEFIARLPDGYETRLGERGVNLSGGQRQRVSIARALLRDPKVLILDEATSALDAQSEAMVRRALEAAMDRRTCLIVAHRLSTVRAAHRIYVLHDGTIAEAGAHDDLMARDGHYASLVRHQTTT